MNHNGGQISIDRYIYVYKESRKKKLRFHIYLNIMVNTIVTFGNNRLSSTPVVIKTDGTIFSLQRKIYLITGVFLLSIIVIPNILSIANNQDDFAYHLLFIVHASSFYIFVDFYIDFLRFSIIIFHFNNNISKYFYFFLK